MLLSRSLLARLALNPQPPPRPLARPAPRKSSASCLAVPGSRVAKKSPDFLLCVQENF